VDTSENALETNICAGFVLGEVSNTENGERMALVQNPGERFWRTDFRLGRNIYVLLSNDITRPSGDDQLIGVMESSELAENVVDTHNRALKKFGPKYLKRLES
jgi:hypothetical protein